MTSSGERPPSIAAPAPPERLSPRLLSRVLLSSALRTFSSESIRSFLRDGAVVPYTVPSAGIAIVHVFDRTRPSKASLVASGKRVLRARGATRIEVRLRKRARSRLGRRTTATVLVRTVFVPAGGAPVVRNRRVTLEG